MKKLLPVTFLLLAQLLFAQIDKKWVVGYSPSILQFDIDTTYNYPLDTPVLMAILTTAANICDDNGQLQFFSNGVYLFDKYGDSIENGIGFHPPKLAAFYDGVANSSQAALILPKGNGLYYYFYYSMSDSAYNHNLPFDLLYYSIVDMNANNGKGKVISKNNVLLQGLPLAPYGLTACKHANGRDWWLVMPQIIKNAYYVFNVAPDIITGPVYQLISTYTFGTITPHGQCTFSNNGNYLAATNFDGGVKVMNFDRCTGIISPWLNLVVPYDSHTQYGIGANGVAFSASDRFLYANTFKEVYQFDLNDTNVQQSVVKIGIEDSLHGAMFDPSQIGPDGKIYISNFNGNTNSLSVIQQPEEKGAACNFKYHSDTMLGSLAVVAVPNMPNYHLGALVGSACDTIVNAINETTENKLQIEVYPNPATNKLILALSTPTNKLNYQILTIESKQITGPIPVTQTNTQIDISSLPSGLYFLILQDEKTRTIKKFIKE